MCKIRAVKFSKPGFRNSGAALRDPAETLGKGEVGGSIPLGSTSFLQDEIFEEDCEISRPERPLQTKKHSANCTANLCKSRAHYSHIALSRFERWKTERASHIKICRADGIGLIHSWNFAASQSPKATRPDRRERP
jgi:hypothetical protein